MIGLSQAMQDREAIDALDRALAQIESAIICPARARAEWTAHRETLRRLRKERDEARACVAELEGGAGK